jgi:RNA polymerase sigma-70 factor (ECF subfamily)
MDVWQPGEFEAAILPHGQSLLARALQLTANAADAADLVQDTFERAFRKRDQLVPGTDARAWLRAILDRKFIDRWRRKRKLERKLIAGIQLIYPNGDWVDPSAHRQYTADELRSALQRLPKRLRLVYELYSLGGLAYEEIAVRLCMPRGTVGTHIARARRELRASLEGCADISVLPSKPPARALTSTADGTGARSATPGGG